jgi:hypothetical protein
MPAARPILGARLVDEPDCGLSVLRAFLTDLVCRAILRFIVIISMCLLFL